MRPRFSITCTAVEQMFPLRSFGLHFNGCFRWNYNSNTGVFFASGLVVCILQSETNTTSLSMKLSSGHYYRCWFPDWDPQSRSHTVATPSGGTADAALCLHFHMQHIAVTILLIDDFWSHIGYALMNKSNFLASQGLPWHTITFHLPMWFQNQPHTRRLQWSRRLILVPGHIPNVSRADPRCLGHCVAVVREHLPMDIMWIW